ncbi:MAG: type II toxin-antitoxin system RelE/ParE family toxin [Eubacteriales bacterium]|nr:type II toxin-antitoxin system RelE/ParE family toxin [Eubacteriales bacterium]
MRIEYSPESINDLQRLKEYITMEFSEYLAVDVVSHIMDTIELLKNFSNIGSSLSSQETEDYWKE